MCMEQGVGGEKTKAEERNSRICMTRRRVSCCWKAQGGHLPSRNNNYTTPGVPDTILQGIQAYQHITDSRDYGLKMLGLLTSDVLLNGRKRNALIATTVVDTIS